MIQGTGSDVGKSFMTSAFCRILANEGVNVTPFKSQNMSDDFITENGGEIGRSQANQAEAAKAKASVWMNPILLKPVSNISSEVILLGKHHATLSGKDYQQQFFHIGLAAIKKALNKLRESYDTVIIEGAGSPVEMNLKDRELVNMRVAELANMPVILVADIERGGVFASILGTLHLLSSSERNRVKGIIINKFRGDRSMFSDGIKYIQEEAGVPVLGVIPYLNGMNDTEPHLEDPFDRIAAFVEKHLNWDQVKRIIEQWEKQ